MNRNGWRVMYVGGTQDVVDVARERLMARYPRARISGCNGYFDASPGSADNAALLKQITAFQPHILFVGMGMPRQEIWTLENHKAYGPAATFTVGGAFDYEAGVQKAAPRWMGPMGMEWLFRLMVDPQRLFSRYCVEPWSLVGLACHDVVRALGRRAASDLRAAENARWEQMRARNEGAR